MYPALIEAPDKSYPVYSNLMKLVSDWNPDNPEVPEVFTETLQHFNFSDPVQRSYAEQFRNAEMPFKLYDIPNVEEVRQKWTATYLKSVMRSSLRVEKSRSNHFMYFKPGRYAPDGWKPPQEVEHMKFDDWYRLAIKADKTKLNYTDEHVYMTIGTSSMREETFFSKGNLL
jgi:hypothetical protein